MECYAKNLLTFARAVGSAKTTTLSYGLISVSPNAMKLLVPLIIPPIIASFGKPRFLSLS